MSLPLWLVLLYAEMLPQLQAAEALETINLVAIGTGSMDERSSQRIRAELERLAERGRQRPKLERNSLAAFLGTMGIKVKYV